MSAYSTVTTPEWTQALENVNTDPLRLIEHGQCALFRGYAFPDPLVFLVEGGKGVEMALTWLVIRAPWMATFTGMEPRRCSLPNPQQWREYLRELSLDYEVVRQDERKSAPPPSAKSTTRVARRHQKTRDAAKDIFSIHKPSRDLVTSLSWNGRVVWSPGKVDLKLADHRLVVWDSHEHNFRLEMFSLDRCVMFEDWANPERQVIREQKLRAVFFQEVTLMAAIPTGLKTIASADPRDRCEFVEAFRLVLMDWPGEIPLILGPLQFHKQLGDKVIWDFSLMHAVEKHIYSFYCQTFFDYFGRAPTIPHTLPLSV